MPTTTIEAYFPVLVQVLLGVAVARPYQTPGWTLTPRLSFNAASYALDEPMSNGKTTGSRIIPTASLDSSWVLERDATSLFDQRAIRQTLEPRVMYVYTPYIHPLGAVWGDTELVWPDDAAPQLDDAISGLRHAPANGALRVADLLREFPAAALFGARAGDDEDAGRAGAGAHRSER